MTPEEFGMLDVECKFMKTEPELITSIATTRNLKPESVKKMTRYNMFTIPQFSLLTGLNVSTIHNYTRPSMEGSKLTTKLDFCYPFPNDEETGPKFIVRNEKSDKYLSVKPEVEPSAEGKPE